MLTMIKGEGFDWNAYYKPQVFGLTQVFGRTDYQSRLYLDHDGL